MMSHSPPPGFATDDDVSTSTGISAAESFDLGTKLADRLREHTAERDRTRRRIDQDTAQLNHLFKSAPKRPRDTRAALQQKVKKLDRDRTSRSLPLQQEKALIRQIDATQKQIRLHDKVEAHQINIRKKKAEIEASKESLRILNATISEIEKALSNVELGKKLGCLPSEVVKREIDCPMNKLGWVIGKDGKNIKEIEEGAGVQIEVDKIRGKVRVRGSESACTEAIEMLENYTKAIDEEVKLSLDVIAYLLLRQSAALNKIKEGNPEVKIDLLSKVMMMRGHPDKVEKAKADVAGVQVVSQSRVLVGKEVSLVIGKTGGTINAMSESHGVAMDLSKEGGDRSTLRIVGLSENVDAATVQLDQLLYDNEEMEESFPVDALMRSELLARSGAGIRAFEGSLKEVLADDHPEAANGVFLVFERNVPRDDSPKLVLKCSRTVMYHAKSLVVKKIDQFQSNVTTMDVPGEMVPIIVGKGGATINELRNEGAGASVEADAGSGVIKIYSTDADTRDAIQEKIKKLVAENQTGSVPIEKASIPFLLGEPGKEVRAACAEIGCNLNVSGDSKVVIRGTDENIEKASVLLQEFLSKNHIDEVNIDSDDEPLLFMGGSDSILHKIEANHNVKARLRKETGILQVRGEADKTSAALNDVKLFLKGGDGMTVCKFQVPEEAIGGVIGKGGSNISNLQSEFEGVLIHVPKDNNTISIRGPDDMVKQCRIRLISSIATTRVNENIDITPEQHEKLANSDALKRISRFTHAQITLNESSIKIRGISADCRDAKANVNEFLTGRYIGYIDLEQGQFTKVESNPSQFQRIHTSTGAKITLEDSSFSIHITGKKSSVKKAKASVMEFLGFMLPSQLQMVKVHRSLFKSMGDPARLARIATDTGASISLDRDMNCILIRSCDSNDCDNALKLVNDFMKECQKLNHVIRFDTSDAWLLPVIVGKNGSTIKQLEKDIEEKTSERASFEIFKDDVSVVITAESEEVVQAGRLALEELVQKAKKECIFIELPESSMAAFIGVKGAGIKKLSAEHAVRVERPKKQTPTIKITGKEDCVARAQVAIETWIKEWEAKHIGSTMMCDERVVPYIVGKGGETIKSIEREFGCKVDINRQKNTLTVRDGTDGDRENTINKIQAIIDEEEAKAAERAASKAKLKEEQAELQAKLKEEQKTKAKHEAQNGTSAAAPKAEAGKTSDIEDKKDRSGEFPAKPVGKAEVKPKSKEKGFNPAIHGTEAGRQLYRWLLTGEVGPLIADEVKDFAGDSATEPNGHGGASSEKAAIVEGAPVTAKRDEKGDIIGYYYQSRDGFSVRLD